MKFNSEDFDIVTLESGQKDRFGDSYYSYKVTSKRPANEVKEYCTKVLKTSYSKEDIPNPFEGELIEFKNLTNFFNDLPEMYSYKVRCAYNG